MNVKEIKVYVTEIKRYEVIMNEENGYDMPIFPRELVDTINAIHNNPANELDLFSLKPIERELNITGYDIEEGEEDE